MGKTVYPIKYLLSMGETTKGVNPWFGKKSLGIECYLSDKLF